MDSSGAHGREAPERPQDAMLCCGAAVMADVVLTLRFVNLSIGCFEPLPQGLCEQLGRIRSRYETLLGQIREMAVDRRNALVSAKVDRDDCEYFVAEPSYTEFVRQASLAGRRVTAHPTASFSCDTRGHWPLLHSVGTRDRQTGMRVQIRVLIHQGEDAQLDALISRRNEIWVEKAMHYSVALHNYVYADRCPP
jgi:hypothetical protein